MVLLARIKVAESDIAQIHKRYEKIEGVIQEKELSVKLQKVERTKETEQQKLELLEKRLKKRNMVEVEVNKALLR